MSDSLFYPLDEPFQSDSKKVQFVALRMERDLFLILSERAKAEQKDISKLIRELLRGSLAK